MSLPRVLVVDDHPLFRRGVIELLRGSGRFEVVGETEDPAEAAAQQQSLGADVVLLDLRLRQASGLAWIAAILEAHPAGRVLVLTMYDEPSFRRAARAAGAHGYVVKSDADTTLLAAMDCVLDGGQFFGPIGSASGPHPVGLGEPSKLTAREREVVRMVSLGHTNRSIAERLGISIKTVEGYRQRVMDKFGFRSRTDLVRFALEIGLVGTGETPALLDD
jgi:two-component system response regulator NreC